MYYFALMQGSHFTREKPIFPGTGGKNPGKRYFSQVFPGFCPGKTQVFFPGFSRVKPGYFSQITPWLFHYLEVSKLQKAFNWISKLIFKQLTILLSGKPIYESVKSVKKPRLKVPCDEATHCLSPFEISLKFLSP